MNMSGAVGDERRRRVANVVHDDGGDDYDEELDPPAANGGVVVDDGGGGGGDLGDLDDDAPSSESSSLIAPSSSSHEGYLGRRLHPPRVDARRRRRDRDDDDDASRGSIPACLVGGTTAMTMLMMVILSSLAALLLLLFGTDDVVVVPPPRSMSSSSSLRVVEEDPRIIVVVRDDPPSPPLLSSAEKRGDVIFTPGMIADDTAAGREYAGARVEVPEARRRCGYVVDAIKARSGNEDGAADNKVLGDKYAAQSADYNVFYRATAILFWRDFGSGHWGRDQNRSIDLDDLVSLRDATYEDGVTPMSPMSAWTWTTGDQHLSNFGAWRNRGGEVVYSVNDFDEAAIYDFHVDVLRVAVSICNHGRSNGFDDGMLRVALEAFTFTYVDTVSCCESSGAAPPPLPSFPPAWWWHRGGFR